MSYFFAKRGWSHTVRALVVFACAITTSQSAGNVWGDEQLRELFLSEAPEAWRSYAARSRMMQGTVQSMVQASETSPQKKGIATYLANQTCRYMIYDSAPATEDVQDEVFSYNERYYFHLQRDPADESWRLGSAATRKDSNQKAQQGVAFVDEMGAINHELISLDATIHTLEALAGRPEFRITSAEWEEIDGERLARIAFASPHPLEENIDNPYQEGVLWLAPQRFWVLRKAHLVHDAGEMRMELAIEKLERNANDEIPIPLRTTSRRTIYSQGSEVAAGVATTEQDFHLTIPADLPSNEEFKLVAFGLPELDRLAEEESPRASSFWFWALIGGTMLIIVGGLAYVAARRRMQAA